MARKKSAQNILVWVLMGLLVVGLAGFGIDGFLSQSVRSIGQVGGRDITTTAYARALQNEIRAIEQQFGQAMPFTQVQAMGLDGQVRAQLVTQAALAAEAERIGISVGDGNVQRTLTSIPAFRGPGGAFDRDTYRFTLQNIGQTPSEFEAEIRRDAARGILQAATAAGVDTPQNLRTAILQHYATRHNFALFTLGEGDLPGSVETPSDAAIEAYYEANQARFMAPEIRTITYAWITPAMLIDSVEVDEASLRQLYESRLGDYVVPERRLIERLVFANQEAAAEAATRLNEGAASFEELVAERGLSLDDTDMGDVTLAQLGAAGEAVFALEEPGDVAGPLPSPVGPALFRMVAILNAQETPFEEAEPELRTELAADRARRMIADDYDLYEDLLAGGASIEDLASETAMELGRIDWARGSSEGIAAYSEFRTAAGAASEGDFAEVSALADGGLFALRLDAITPPAPRPLAEVADEARAGARAEAVASALLRHGQELSAELARAGTEAFSEAQGLVPEGFEQITRTDRLSDLPQPLLEQIFDAEPGTPVLHVAGERGYLAIAAERQPPDPEDAQTARLIEAIDEQIGAALAQDVFSYFARALEREAGITLNQAAIEAVHTNFR